MWDKRSPAIVATACGLILMSRVAETAWLVLPEFISPPPLWLVAAAVLALGGTMTLLFSRGLRSFPIVAAFREAR
jgi:hypothetical protein